jgi:hypothetical protein
LGFASRWRRAQGVAVTAPLDHREVGFHSLASF